jgi:hypothetical protein
MTMIHVDNYEVFQGAALSILATLRDGQGQVVTDYVGSEPLLATVWKGGELTSTFTAASSWATPASGTVLITAAGTQTTGQPPGRYSLLLQVYSGGSWADAYEATITILPAAGGGSTPSIDLITAADITDRRLRNHPDLDDLITAASDLVQQHCRRTFAQATLTELYDGDNRPRIWLRRPPIASVSAITVNSWAIDNTDGDAWVFDADTGELRRGSGWDDQNFTSWFPRGLQNVQVSYVGGYSTIPALVKRATRIWVKHLALTERHTGVFNSEKIGDYSYTLGKSEDLAAPAVVQAMLTNYVLDWVH